ncbi:MAG: hypothetical protein JEZ08_23430 [Clostridiales bacterium]|nr:hypothetical protein [Clostridiales bacterium]
MSKLNFEHYTVVLNEIIRETGDVYTFRFDKPNMTWHEGTNIHLAFDDFLDHEPKKFVRHFSVTNLPSESYIAFTTRLSNSPYKNRLKSLKPGDHMILYKLSQRMKIRYENRPLVLISMGVGIAAMKPIMETYVVTPDGIESLTNITISKNEKIYKSYLENLQGIQHNFVNNRKEFYHLINETYDHNNIYYIVGSDRFIEDIILVLKHKGHHYSDIEIDKKQTKKDILLKP